MRAAEQRADGLSDFAAVAGSACDFVDEYRALLLKHGERLSLETLSKLSERVLDEEDGK